MDTVAEPTLVAFAREVAEMSDRLYEMRVGLMEAPTPNVAFRDEARGALVVAAVALTHAGYELERAASGGRLLTAEVRPV